MRLRLLVEMPMKQDSDLSLPIQIKRHNNLVEIDAGPHGGLSIMHCPGADGLKLWSVRYSSAVKGFGPLLYDIAMEWATLNGDGLISDFAASTSDAARRVWDYYFERRKDVKHYPIPPATLNKIADYVQNMVGVRIPLEGSSAFYYSKQPTRIQELLKSGLLVQ